MDNLSFLGLLIDCCACLVSLLRICTNKGEVFDYFIVISTLGILVYDFCKIIKLYSKKVKDNRTEDERNTGDDSVC